MPEAVVFVPLYLISHAPVEARKRAASAFESPSKSNDVLPDGTGGGGEADIALELLVEKNPKNDLNESPMENRTAVAGATGCAISKPSGSGGVLKKLATEMKLSVKVELIVKIVEANLAEKLSEDETIKGVGGATFGADLCDKDKFETFKEASVLFVRSPNKNIGINKKVINAETINLLFIV